LGIQVLTLEAEDDRIRVVMQKVIRTGNSLAVTIPALFVRSVGIRAGDKVKVILKPDSGKVIFSFFGAKQLPLPGEIITKKQKRS